LFLGLWAASVTPTTVCRTTCKFYNQSRCNDSIRLELLQCITRFYAACFSHRSSVCPSVCPSICHMGGSVKNDASYDHQIFIISCLEDSSFRNRKAFP